MLGTLGKREREAGDPNLSASERPIVRRQVLRVIVQSAVLAAAITAAIYVLP